MLTPSIPTALPPLRTCCHACHTCCFSMGCVFASVRPLLLSRGGVPNSGCFVASFAPGSLQPPSSLVRRHLTSCPASNGLASWELHLCVPLLIGCMISLVPCKSLAGSPATYMPGSGRATMSSLAIPVLVPQALTIPRFSNRYVLLDTSSVVHLRSALRASPETGPRPFSLYRSTPGPREPSTGGWFDESSLVKFSSVGLPPSSTQLRIGYWTLFLLPILESHVRHPGSSRQSFIDHLYIASKEKSGRNYVEYYFRDHHYLLIHIHTIVFALEIHSCYLLPILHAPKTTRTRIRFNQFKKCLVMH